ncbi:MAG: MFS transporter, partial [Microbacterium sp.]
LATIVALLLLRREELIVQSREAGAAGFLRGFSYVARRSDLVIMCIMGFLLGAIALNLPLFIAISTISFGEAADGLGILQSLAGAGSLVGALLAAQRPYARTSLVIWCTGIFSISAVAAAYMPTFWLYGATLLVVGFATSAALSTANAYVQTMTEAPVRGRVLAVFLAILMAGTPVGAPIIGYIADQCGTQAANLFGGLAALVAFLIGLLWSIIARRKQRDRELTYRQQTWAAAEDELAPVEEFSDVAALYSPLQVRATTETPASNSDMKSSLNGREGSLTRFPGHLS